jgi:hypothetical protein
MARAGSATWGTLPIESRRGANVPMFGTFNPPGSDKLDIPRGPRRARYFVVNVGPDAATMKRCVRRRGFTLDLYSHVVLGMQEEAAAKLEALLFG